MTDSVQRGYAPVREHRLYYEIHGSDRHDRVPLLLLHGGGDTITTSFGELLPALARSRRVIAFEQRGFGHSPDIADRPFDFEDSAADAAALMHELGIGRADVLGFSNGGTIALQLAIRRPEAVRRLILVSTLFSRAGVEPQFWAGFDGAKLGDMPAVLQDAYLAVAPEPDVQRFFDKCVQRMRRFEDLPTGRLRAIAAPALVVAGDSDIVRPEHAVELYRLLPQAQLLVLPNTDHMRVTARTQWLVPAIDAFLEQE